MLRVHLLMRQTVAAQQHKVLHSNALHVISLAAIRKLFGGACCDSRASDFAQVLALESVAHSSGQHFVHDELLCIAVKCLGNGVNRIRVIVCMLGTLKR
mmetsp:Transcript_4334/g.11882  ORF Transcript_4334/g.11882 Transcript_4334/m.11882 type:complete len:99 (+) Transcript_4334:767-1063(+)